MKLELFVLCCVLHSIAGAIIPDVESKLKPSKLSYEISPLIVGGVDAEEGQVPYQCRMKDSNTVLLAGACVIISSKFVLTIGSSASQNGLVSSIVS